MASGQDGSNCRSSKPSCCHARSPTTGAESSPSNRRLFVDSETRRSWAGPEAGAPALADAGNIVRAARSRREANRTVMAAPEQEFGAAATTGGDGGTATREKQGAGDGASAVHELLVLDAVRLIRFDAQPTTALLL